MTNYTYDGAPTSAVKNKLGARTHDELEKREARHVAQRDVEIMEGFGPEATFDAAHLKAIHHYLFQDVYEWAGHTRDEKVVLSDGIVATEPSLRKADGQPFLAGSLIPDALDHIADTLREADYLRGLSREEFATRAADMMVEINGVHAFREGNGRTQRVFMRELAKEAGHELDFSVVTQERMIQACIAGNEHDDRSMMRRMFVEISDPVRVAALGPAMHSLEKHGMKWNNLYIATAEPGHPVEVAMAGIAAKHFMARAGSQILIGQASDLPDPSPQTGAVFTFTPSSWRREERVHIPDREAIMSSSEGIAQSVEKAASKSFSVMLTTGEKLLDLIDSVADFFFATPRTVTPQQAAASKAAMVEYMQAVAFERRRELSYDRMMEARAAGKHLTRDDVRYLSEADRTNYRRHGDSAIDAIFRERELEQERRRARFRQR